MSALLRFSRSRVPVYVDIDIVLRQLRTGAGSVAVSNIAVAAEAANAAAAAAAAAARAALRLDRWPVRPAVGRPNPRTRRSGGGAQSSGSSGSSGRPAPIS